MFMIALLCLLLALLALLLLRPPPPHSPLPDPSPDDDLLSVQHPDPRVTFPPQSLPPPTRHVSFSLLSSNTSYSLPASPTPTPTPTLPIHRRWSSPFHKRKSSASASPCVPQSNTVQDSPAPADQFGRLPSSYSPASFDSHPSTKSASRLSTPLRLPFTSKRRSSSASFTSPLIRLDQVNPRAPSPPPSTFAPPSSPVPQRTRFVNPFRKHSRSRTLSPPSTFQSPDTPSNPSSKSPPFQPLPGRRSLVNKFKSVFKSIPPEPSPIIHSKPIVKTINSRLRRPVARTQPYGPPWNALMPVPEFNLSQHSLQNHAEIMSPSLQTSRKHSANESSLPEKALMTLGQLSPRTFINELDEKLSLLQQQRIQDPIRLPHE